MGLFDKLFGKKEEINPNHIYAPMAGEVVEINVVPDPTFAEGMLGTALPSSPLTARSMRLSMALWTPCLTPVMPAA